MTSHPPHLRAYILSRQGGDRQPTPLASRKSQGDRGVSFPWLGQPHTRDPNFAFIRQNQVLIICLHLLIPAEPLWSLSGSLCSPWSRLLHVCGMEAKVLKQHQCSSQPGTSVPFSPLLFSSFCSGCPRESSEEPISNLDGLMFIATFP